MRQEFIDSQTSIHHDTFEPSNCTEPVLLASHYDLDAIGASYFAGKLFEAKKRICCGYPKLLNKLKENVDVSDTVVFVDLCLPDDIMEFALANFKNVYYCDHHLESEKWSKYKDLPNFHYLFSHDYSATFLMAYKCEQTSNKKLSGAEFELCMATDHYDMWHTDTKWFKIGYNLNHMFWNEGYFTLIRTYFELVDKSSITEVLTEEQRQYCITQNKIIKEYINNPDNVVEIEDSRLKMAIFIFGNDTFFVNDVLLVKPEYDVVVGINPNSNSMSIRSSLDDINMNDMIQELLKLGTIKTGGGHAKACGIGFNDSDNDFDSKFTTAALVLQHIENAYDNK